MARELAPPNALATVGNWSKANVMEKSLRSISANRLGKLKAIKETEVKAPNSGA